MQGGTEQIPSLEPSDSVVIFHPESSEVITVDGTDQKDGRKRDRERRRPSGRDRDRRDRDDRTRDRDRDRDRGGARRGLGNWDKSSGKGTSRRGDGRDREKNGDSIRRENWAEFQRRQKTRQTESRNTKRSKDPNRDTTYDYVVPQNYLYDDRSVQEYESAKKRKGSNRIGVNRNSPDSWKHDKYDPNEQANLPEDGDSSFDRWALADYIK